MEGASIPVLAWLGSMLIHVNASGVSPRGWEIIPREVEQGGLGQELCSEYQQLSPRRLELTSRDSGIRRSELQLWRNFQQTNSVILPTAKDGQWERG